MLRKYGADTRFPINCLEHEGENEDEDEDEQAP